MTVDGRRRFSTWRTARRRVRLYHGDHQASRCDLDLVNEHPFRQWQQWRLFHHNLIFGDETIRLSASHGRDYTTTGQFVVSCKRAVSPPTSHDPSPTFPPSRQPPLTRVFPARK